MMTLTRPDSRSWLYYQAFPPREESQAGCEELRCVSLAMAERQTVTAELVLQPSPVTLVEDGLATLTGEQGQPLQLLVRGGRGRDVWIFSVTVCDDLGNSVSGLEVSKVSNSWGFLQDHSSSSLHLHI